MNFREHFAWVFLAVWMTIYISAETQVAVTARKIRLRPGKFKTEDPWLG